MINDFSVGSDTLHISLNDFEIGENAPLTIKQADINRGTGLVTGDNFLYREGRRGNRAENEEVRGKGGFLNEEFYNLDVLPDKGELVRFGTGRNISSLLNINLSLPRIYTRGNNLQPINQSQAGEVLTFIQKELKSNDIHCNIFNGTLTRMDLFKNIYTDEPMETYLPIYGVLNGSRAKDKTTYGVTGCLFRNTVIQYAIYDKMALMIKNKMDVSDYPKYISRYEQRLLSKGKIERTTGFNTVRDMVKNYKLLPEIYLKGWAGEIFKYTGKDVLVMYARQIEKELFYFMFDEYGNVKRNWQQKHLQMKGLQYIVENQGKDVYKIALENVMALTYKKKNTITQKVKRAMDKLNEIKTDLEMLKDSDVPDKTILTLYNELRNKLFKQVA